MLVAKNSANCLMRIISFHKRSKFKLKKYTFFSQLDILESFSFLIDKIHVTYEYFRFLNKLLSSKR